MCSTIAFSSTSLGSQFVPLTATRVAGRRKFVKDVDNERYYFRNAGSVVVPSQSWTVQTTVVGRFQSLWGLEVLVGEVLLYFLKFFYIKIVPIILEVQFKGDFTSPWLVKRSGQTRIEVLLKKSRYSVTKFVDHQTLRVLQNVSATGPVAPSWMATMSMTTTTISVHCSATGTGARLRSIRGAKGTAMINPRVWLQIFGGHHEGTVLELEPTSFITVICHFRGVSTFTAFPKMQMVNRIVPAKFGVKEIK